MKNNLWRVFVVALFLGLAVVGCATVPLSTAEEDLRVKSLLAPPNAALVYLYRNESMGAAVKMAVLMDGANSGETVSKTYMVWQVVPGRHALVSKAENDSQIDLWRSQVASTTCGRK